MPRRMFQKVGEPGNRRVRKLLAEGVAVHSHYSGLDMPAIQLHRLAHVAGLPDAIDNLHGSDIAKSVQDLQGALPHDWRPQCCHGNLLERLDPLLREQLEILRAVADGDLERDIDELKTGKGSLSTKAQIAELSDKTGKRLVESLMEHPVGDDFAGAPALSYCYFHDKRCPTANICEGSVNISTGGSECKDYSSFGQQKGCFGKGIVAFIVWLFGTKYRAPDFIVHENVPRWKTKAMWIVEKVLHQDYRVEAICSTPDFFGVPSLGPSARTIGVATHARFAPTTLRSTNRLRPGAICDMEVAIRGGLHG